MSATYPPDKVGEQINADNLKLQDRVRVTYTGTVVSRFGTSPAYVRVKLARDDDSDYGRAAVPVAGDVTFELLARPKLEPKYRVGTVLGADREVVVVVPDAVDETVLRVRKLFGFRSTQTLESWLDAHPTGHTVFFDPKADSRFAKYETPPNNATSRAAYECTERYDDRPERERAVERTRERYRGILDGMDGA
jgi:hypothetical protein